MNPKIDFSDCEFINEEMKFYTFYDFCDNRYALKYLFKKLNRNAQRFYMWYVYANVHMETYFKNAIWDYLNGFCEEERILNLKKQYHSK